MKKLLATFVALILISAFTVTAVGTTLGYWDTLSGSAYNLIYAGSWRGTKTVADAIYDTIFNKWHKDENGTVVVDEENPVYKDYTDAEMEETIEILEEFFENFLKINPDTGETSFPDRADVQYVDVDVPKALLPGDSVQISKLIEFSNFSQEIYWSPVLISLGLEGEDGQDVSDFMIEILVDYAAVEQFQYTYIFDDKELAFVRSGGEANVSQGTATAYKNSYSAVDSTVYTDVSVNKFNGQYNNSLPLTSAVTYRHALNPITKTGQYGRFPTGAKVLVDTYTQQWINGQPYYMQELKAFGSTTGLSLVGKPNGYRNEMRVSFEHRIPLVLEYDSNNNPVYQSSLPIIINVSRGLKLDESGNPAADQSTDAVVPVIDFKVVQGQVWNVD